MHNITPEINAIIESAYTEKLAAAYSCAPADRASVEAAITRLYERHQDLMPSIGERLQSGTPAVERFIWCRSLDEVAKILEETGIGNKIPAWGIRNVGWLTQLEIGSNLDEMLNGEKIETSEEEEDRRDASILNQCMMVWMFDDVVILDMPGELHVNHNGDLHNESGPAILWKDGSSEWSIGGHEVTEKIVMAPESITVSDIKGEDNAETRRIMISRFGLERYIGATGAKVLDKDEYFGFPRLLISLDDDSLWLWGTDSGTGRVYDMPVFDGATTCREAHEGICGFREDLISGQS